MFVALLPLLLQFTPTIVTGIEKLFGHGGGATKKQTAVNLLGDVANAVAAAQGIPGANSELMVFISDVIEAYVKYANASGQFSHGGTTK
jgi:hypothetical protein